MARLFSFFALIALPALSWAQSIPAMTWGSPVNVSNTSGQSSYYPSVAATGDTVHVIWWDNAETHPMWLYYKRSLDGGTTWQDQRVLSTAMSYVYDVVVYGNKVIAFWRELQSGQYLIRYASSTDAGATWSAVQDLSPLGDIRGVAAAMEGGQAVVAWWEVSGSTVTVKLRRSTDEGATWAAAVNAATFTTDPSVGTFVDITLAGSAIVVGYTETPWAVRTVRSTDGGQNWSSPVLVYSAPANAQGFLRMAAYGSSVVMRWNHYIGSFNDHDYAAASTDGGVSWSTPVNLSEGLSGGKMYGDICIWGNRAVTVWANNPGGASSLYYRRSLNGGQTWEPAIQIPFGADFLPPKCAATSNSVYVVGYSPGGPSSSEIYLVRGQASGADLEISGKIAFGAARDGTGQIYTMDSDGSSQARLAVSGFYADGPSWSPDGTKIAFQDRVNGGIYLMNADGTGQINLTSTPDYVTAWSPDGTKIALYSERDGNGEIYVMNPDGTGSIRLTNNPAFDGYVSWSPDGTKIAFESSRDGGDHEIYVMNADGTAQTRVTTAPGIDYQPAWSPDGTKILFTSRRNGGQDDLYVINPDGTGETRLTSSALVELGPAWSADGTKIVYTVDQGSNYEVYIMNADGSNQTRLTNNAAGDMSYSGGWGEAFRRIGAAAVGTPVSRTLTIKNRGDATLNVTNITSSDGQFTASPTSFSLAPGSSQNVTITFTPTSAGVKYSTLTLTSNDATSPTAKLMVNGTGQAPDLEISGKIAFYSTRDGNQEIYTMNADGSTQTRLTNNGAGDANPALSPDGTKIAFPSNRDGNWEIYVMNADGTGQTRLTNNPANEVGCAWSPDGAKIVFSSDRDGNWEVYVMNADGSGQTNLTNNSAYDVGYAWSPDGTKIAFRADRNGNGEIYVMNADGSGQTNLTNNSALEGNPAWSPEGTKIAFTSNRDGNDEIYAMNADGSAQIRLTNSSGVDGASSWSPDGTKIAFYSERDGNAEIYVMNADGSSQTRLTNNSAEDAMAPGSWGEAFRRIGAAAVGSSAARTMTIENKGSATLNVTSITSSDGQFTLSPTNFSVTAGSSQSVTVTFTPTSAGVKYSTLTITSNDATSPTAKLMVNGTAIQPPPSLSGVSPTRNDADAARNANVTATFSQTMNAGTATTFVVHGSATGRLSGIYGGGGSATLSFDPGADFKPGETVEVSLTSGIQSAGGTSISPQVWKFTAAAGTGPAQFTAISRNIGPGNDLTYDMALGDVDADGDLDLAVGNGGGSGPAQSMVYLNDGGGNFTAGTRNFGTGSDQTGAVAFGDVDRDGDLDIAVGKWNQQDAVYLNDGGGTFTAGTRNFGTGSEITTSVAFGDVDRDGDLDIAVGNYNNQQNAVYLNDGNGNFTAGTRNFGTGSDNTQLVALGDVDGDGDLDIAVGNYNWPGGQQSAVYLNDGSGNFTAGTRNFGGSHNTICVAFGDVDGDGDLDVAAGNDSAQNAVYLNDGSGNFTAGTRNFGTGSDVSQTVAFGDVDGDGDLDIAVGNYDAQQDVVYLNDGNGNFTAGTRNFGTGSDQTIPVVLGDVDGDTDLDIVVGTNSYQNAVYLNQTATPQISVSASSVAAGTVNVGSSGTATFTVGNTGSAALSVTGITVGGTDASQFTVSPSSFTVNAGAAAQTVTATFAPTSAGSKSASLSIVHNATGSPSTMSLSGTGAQPSAPAFYTSLTSWTKYAANPVLNVSPGQFDAGDVYSPMVLYDGMYRMWYVGSPGSGVNTHIGYATSADGITWTKYGVVLDVGSGWEQQSIHAPSVIKDGGLYKMWYSGHSGSSWHFDIGYATSPDGQTWTKYAGNPVFPGSSVGSSTELYLGTVTKEGTSYKMWYGATSPSLPFHMRYATSPDGITWTDSGQILGAGSPGAWDESLGAYCNVLKKGEMYEMWYEGIRAGVYAIGYATSADGITWTKSPYNPVLSKGSAGSWEGTHVNDPAVLLEGETHKMWYRGYDGSLSRIGYATSGSATAASMLSFGNVNLGSSGTQAFTVANAGNAALTVSSIAISGTDASQFSVSPTSFTINPGGAAQTVTVTLAPTSAGAKSGALTIAHNAPGSLTVVALSGTGQDVIAPIPPVGLAATPGNAQIALTWTANTESDLSHYVVYRNTTSNFTPAATDSIARVNKPTATYTNTGLSAGTYYFKVAAVDSANNKSTPSAQVSASPLVVDTDPPWWQVPLPSDAVVLYRQTFEGLSLGASPEGWSTSGSIIATSSPAYTGSRAAQVTGNLPYKSYRLASAYTSGTITMEGAIKAAAGGNCGFMADLGVYPQGDDGFNAVWWGSDGAWHSYNAAGGLNTFSTTVGDWHRIKVTIHLGATPTYDLDFDSSRIVSGAMYGGGVAGTSSFRGISLQGGYSNSNYVDDLRVVYTPGDTTPPAAPTGLAATAGNGQAVLTWTVNSESDLSHYVVYRSTTNNFTPAAADSIGRVNKPTTTYTSTGLTSGTYYFKLAAVDSANNKSAVSAQASASIQTGISLSASALSFGNVEKGQSAQQIFRIKNTGTATLTVSGLSRDTNQFNVSPTVPPNLSINAGDSTTVTVTFSPTSIGAKADTVRITHNATGSPAKVALAGTGADTTKPATPAGLAATPDNAQIALAWTVNTESDLSHYVVYRSTTNNFTPAATDSIARVNKPTATYTNTGLSAGTYYFKLAAVDSAGNKSAVSAQASASINILVKANDPNPSSLRFTGSGSLSVTVADSGNTSLSVTPSLSGTDAAQFSVSPNTVTTVAPGATQSFTVTFTPSPAAGNNRTATLSLAHNATNKASPLTVALVGDVPPTAPANLSADGGINRAVLNWTANSEGDLSHYVVYRSTANNFTPTAADSIARVNKPTTTFANTGLRGGTYYFRLAAVDSAGNKSAFSTQDSAIIEPHITVSPTALSFGNVRTGATRTQTFTVANTGTDTLKVSALSLSGTDAGRFTLTPSSFSVAPGAAAQVVSGIFSPTVGSQSATPKSAVLSFTDNAPESPQLSLSGTATAPAITISPSPLDFGSVTIGQSATSQLTVTNTGTDTLLVTTLAPSGSNANQFPLAAGQGNPLYTMAPNASQVISVPFTPTSAGAKSAPLTLTHNAAPTATSTAVLLSGTGSNIPVPTLSPNPAAFGSVKVGQNRLLALTVINNSTEVLLVNNITSSDSAFTVFPDSLSVPEKNSTHVMITFAPMDRSPKDATLTLTFTTSAGPASVTATLTGQGTQPVIAVPDSLRFGDVNIEMEQRRTLPLTIYNTGNDTLVLSEITRPTDVFSVTPTTPPAISLRGGDSTRVNVTFAPTSTRVDTASVTIRSNAANAPSVRIGLSGRGTLVGLVVRPDTLDFGRVRLDSVGTRTLTVANPGNLPLAIRSTASSNPRFSAPPGTFSVNGGDSARVAVSFAPVQKGVETGALTLSGNAQREKGVVLRGEGVRPEIAVFPDSLDFLEVVMPGTGVLPLQVSNPGNDTLRVTRINRDNLRFTLSDSIFALPPDSAKSLTVRFAPTQPGRVELGRLVLATNAGNREVRVRGRGIEYDWTLSPSPLEFGRVRVDSSRSRTISIVNRGQAGVKIDSLVVVGGGKAVELVRLDLPPRIAGGATVDVATLRFAPRTAGQLSGVALRVKSGEVVRSDSIMGEGTTPPDMAAIPDSLALGPVALGSSVSGSIEVRNAGGDTLHLSQWRAMQEGFTVLPAALAIAPNASGTVTVRFRPAVERGVSGRLIFTSDDPSPPQIKLSGSVIPPPIILSFAPADTLRFGVVSLGWSELQPLVIRNRGRGTLKAVLRSESEEFAPEQGDTLRIAAQDSMQALIRFTPAQPGHRFGNLLIASNDLQVPLAVLVMRGEGGGLRLEPPAIDFGEVVVGSRVDTAIQVINQSAGQWTISLSATSPGFGINPTALRLEPRTSGRVQVWFQPTAKDSSYSGKIEVRDRPLLNVTLSGISVEGPDIEVSPSPVFGEVGVGTVGVGTLTVQNKGHGLLKIYDLSSSRLEYQVAQADSLPLVIPPGKDHSLQVSFTPDTTGEVRGSLTIVCNDPDEREVVRLLNGQGRVGLRLQPCITVISGEQEEELYFGRLEAGEEGELPLVVRNDCQGVLRVERIEADSRQVAADPESLVVAAGESRRVGMRLRAELGEAQEGVIRLVSNDPDHQVVRRRWHYTPERPCAEVLTEQLRFGPAEGGQRTALLAIANPCSARLLVELVDEERQLTFAEERLVVEPEQQERVRVSYAGSGGSGQVVLATNDPAQRQLTIPWEAQAPLQVRSALPREGTTGVSRQTTAQLEFDQALRRVGKGLASMQLQILPEPLNNWRRQVQVEGYILSVPLELAAGTSYRLVVVEAEAQSGARLSAPFELHFSTAVQALVVGSIAGRVLFDDGSSVVGTVFLANMQKELVGSARITQDGSFTLRKVPEGRYQLFAQEKATGLSIAYEQEVEVRAGQTTGDIDLLLPAQQSIEKKVVVLSGEVIIEEAPEELADSTFAVPIHTKGVQDLSGFAIQVSFDPEDVALVEVRPDSPTEKNVLYSAGGFPMFLSLVRDAGNMEFGGSLLGPEMSQAPDGDGLLAYFIFRALRDPTEVEVVQVRRRTLRGEDVVSGGIIRPRKGMATDFTGDGKVDFDDFFHFADHFGKSAQGEVAACDLDKSGTVDFSDFFIFADDFGKAGGSVAKLLALAQEILGLPASSQLEQNSPNPFNAQTAIRYQLAVPGWVKLAVYDLLGQQVRTLVEEMKEGGVYQVVWDGRDKAGNTVASGVYFSRLEAGSFHAVRKMLLLR